MSTAHTLHSPAPTPDATERINRHLRVLAELIEIGMTIARTLPQQAAREATLRQAGAADPNSVARPRTADATLCYTRIERAIRMAIRLESAFSDTVDQREHNRRAARTILEARGALKPQLRQAAPDPSTHAETSPHVLDQRLTQLARELESIA